MIAALLACVSSGALARTDPTADLNTYVRARTASAAGAERQASAGFTAALNAAPDNAIVANQALAHAVSAGVWPLALRAARSLERLGNLLPDARFVLLAGAYRERDWRVAGQQIDAIERERLFAFTVPVLRAWLARGSGQGDPLSFLPTSGLDTLSESYAAEHRPLLMMALRRPEGAALLPAASGGPRALRLRMAAAATLAERGDRAGALALLQGEEAASLAARRLIESGRPLPGAIDTAPAALAELLVRLALDLHGQNVTPVAATFARLSTWLAPESAETWMVAAELAALQDRHGAGVAMLANIPASDPYAASARDQRVRLLVAGGDNVQALTDAETSARATGAGVGEQVRLGEVLMQLDRPGDAAAAFARAIEARTAQGDGGGATYPMWVLWLMRGGAHDDAEDWPAARSALQQAYQLAPTEPLVLNYLGYAQLERRENMVEAEALVREAHRLAPENAAITDSLGWALFLKGERAEGIALLEQAAQASPDDVEINEHLGDAYFATGRRSEARFAWTAARVHAEGADATRLAAKIETGLTAALAAR